MIRSKDGCERSFASCGTAGSDLGQDLASARLFYGDPATGEAFELLLDPSGDMFQATENGAGLLPLPERIISIGEDAAGELFLAAVGIDPRLGGGQDGMIVRIMPALLLRGDVNSDSSVDLLDIAPFINAQVAEGDEDAFLLLTVGGCFLCADINMDGLVDFLDISPFINLLDEVAAAFPEPASGMLLLTIGLATARRRFRP